MGLEYIFTYIYYICMANGSKYPPYMEHMGIIRILP